MSVVFRPLRLPLAAACLAATAAGAAAQPQVRIPTQERVLAGTPTQVFAIGTEEGRSWEMFSTVQQLAFDRSDNLYVLDRGNTRVLVFDRTGRFVREVGKKGDGPGELQVPMSIAVLADGTLAVSDLAHRNLSLYGPDGAFRRSIPYGEDLGMFGREMYPHPAGGVVGFSRPLGERGGSGRITRQNSLTRLPLTGASTALFRIPEVVNVQTTNSGSGTAQRREMRMEMARIFSPRTAWGVLPDGSLAVAHTNGYTVKIVGPDGRERRWVQRPMRTRLTTEADKENYRERRRREPPGGRGMVMIVNGGPGGGGGARAPQAPSQADVERSLANLTFADTIPAIQGLRVSAAGRIWVERTGRWFGEPGPIDIVTPEGQYIGTLQGQRLPEAISSTGRAAYIETDDETGVERVVVRQLPAAWR